MRRYLNILLAISLVSLCGCSIFNAGKCNPPAQQVQVQLTPYAKFLKDKKVSTTPGWITTHTAKDKCYVEFPIGLLGQDMLYTSSIERTSDNREGAVGQFSDDGLVVYFTLKDSTLLAHIRLLYPMLNETGDGSLDDALANSYAPGIFKTLKIEAWTPDRSAVVVDMTKFFIEHNEYASPFPKSSASTMLGFKSRQHKLVEAESYPRSAGCNGQTLMVECAMRYNVDIYSMGNLSEKDVPVNITVNKMLSPLPAAPMRPRVADSRIGTATEGRRRITDGMNIEDIRYVRRWRIEPSDPQAYARGEKVDPVKPIVFYLDSLMPAYWKPYVVAGVTEWNKAFEKIGFTNVLRVEDYPDDPGFNANNIAHSKIIYSPLWSYYPETSMLCDPRSGEILNSSILLPSNFTSILQRNRIIYSMGADASVRRGQFSEEQTGHLIKSCMMVYTGLALGLGPNMAASAAYPVDSLRSATFTQEWGIASSVMEQMVINFVAQPEDVERGVAMTQEKIGPYDYYALSWMYRPIDGARTPDEEVPTLDRWIEEKAGDPVYRYYTPQYPQVAFDPTAVSGDLGDDPMRAAELFALNSKRLAANFYTWFEGHDKDITYRESLFAFVAFGYAGKLNNVINLVGGIYRNDVKKGDPRPAFRVVPRETQRKAVKFILEASRDLDWVNNVGNRNRMGLNSGTSTSRMDLLGSLLGRTSRLAVCVEKDPGAYSPEELVNDVYNEVWKNTIQGRALAWQDIRLQQDILGVIMSSAEVTQAPQAPGPPPSAFAENIAGAFRYPLSEYEIAEAGMFSAPLNGSVQGFEPSTEQIKAVRGPVSQLYYGMLLRTRDLIQSRIATSSGDTLAHYRFMLFKIKQVLEQK